MVTELQINLCYFGMMLTGKPCLPIGPEILASPRAPIGPCNNDYYIYE